jgi:hypothetical protein
VVAQTQSGPALVLDLLAGAFYEPGPLPATLAALLGLAVPHQPAAADGDGAAGGAADAGAAAAQRVAAAAALSALAAADWQRAEALLQGLNVRRAAGLC